MRFAGKAAFSTSRLLLLFGKFVVPFVALLPRANKRRIERARDRGRAGCLLMDACDLAWLVLPRAGGFLAHSRFGAVRQA